MKSTQINQQSYSYACFSKDLKLRLSSSSGAMFSLYASYILKHGGVVYGVSFTDDFKSAEFRRVTSERELDPLRCSKYFQAHMGNTYINVKNDLDNGITVFFCGTGCQVNGLKKFLIKEYTNLYTADIICHGTPSQALWQKYLDYVKSSNTDEIEKINLRCKTYKNQKIVKDGNNLYVSMKENSFMRLFLKDCCLRPSCYGCKARTSRMSDVTIADFWGISNIIPEMNDGNGCSLVITRTSKGLSLFKDIRDQIIYREVSYEDAVKNNPSEYRSCTRPKSRDTFYQDMNTLGIEQLVDKYANDFKTRFWRNAANTKKSMKRMLKCKNSPNNSDYGMLIEFRSKEKSN